MKNQLFNDNWKFKKTKLGIGFSEARNNGQFQSVEVPHDWLIYDTHNLYEAGTGWYKKEFHINDLTEADYYSFRFEGVYRDVSVYINAEIAFEWKNGYTTFEFDATPFLKIGENEMIVQVRYESPNSRWYSGAGIYRNVWIKHGFKDHFIHDSIYITPVLQSDGQWNVEIDAEIKNTKNSEYTVRHSIIDSYGAVQAVNFQIQKSPNDSQVLQVANPKLWDVYQGNLYYVKSELISNEEVIDEQINRFGFRTVEMSPTGGFVLNGKRIKLYGVCQHHDLGALGAAMNKTALRRQFDLLIKMGMNAIRTAHNVFSVEFMELADELGIIVCSEIFDIWKNRKTTYDYAQFFDEWHERDMASWIRRDRNSPSVVMWSVGNEVSDTHNREDGVETTKQLMSLVALHDPKGHGVATFGSNYLPWEPTQKAGDAIKLVGYNYGAKYYHDHHKKYPDWIIYGSETASTVQSRGVYKFPLSQAVLADDDEQCSTLGNGNTSWGARSTEDCIIADRDAKFSLGQFIWTGTDYIGEPTPYHTKNSYLGQIDTAGFYKDTAYIYQAEWTDYKKNPMVHIFPYWDFSPGQLIDVRVTSNAPKVELFLDEKSMGTFEIDHSHGKKLVGNWQIPYEEGKLKALAYDETGNIIATDTASSFGDAVAITITPDKTELRGDGEDLIFIEINTIDKNENYVANANNRIEVSVSGAGRLIGLDNGDATDYDSYKGTSRRLFNGKLLAIVAGNNTSGEIVFSATSPTLTTTSTTFRVIDADLKTGTSNFLESNRKSLENHEIPIRKVELVTDGGNFLNENQRTAVVKAKIHPANATYSDLTWRVTNAAGIDSTIAQMEIISDDEIKLTALGDGEFYVRCMTKNGAQKTRLISALDFRATGLGEAYLDPYGFISGGLYTDSNIELTNGNDRGVATDRELESHVVFDNINFGEIGSDTITMPLFPLMPNTFPIEIWEGKPGIGSSELIDTVYYDLGSQWNTYKAKTFKLPRRFKGLNTISFVFKQKVHIKGFSFEKYEKAYEQIDAINYNFISGDSYSVSDKAVEKIGNNVTLIFDNMDFSSQGLRKIQICGRTPLGINPIQIRFSDGENEITQAVDFIHSDDYEVQAFDLNTIGLNKQVSFIFMPGTQFDFKWFRFV